MGTLVVSIPAKSADGNYYGRYPLGKPQLSVALGLTPTTSDPAILAASPWTFGHPFKQGDVPPGAYLTAVSGASAFQADARNYWPDGSVKYAVLSGISDFPSSSQMPVQLSITTTAPTGTNVPEPTDLPNAKVVLSTTPGIYSISAGGTYSLNSVLGVALAGGWTNSTTGGRVRQVLGPVMSEFHYFQPTSDPHLSIWWFVRAYTDGKGGIGAVEIERVFENGWFLKSTPTGPAQKDYTVACYTSSAATPDFSGTIGWAVPPNFSAPINYYSSPAAGELIYTGVNPFSGQEGSGSLGANSQLYVNNDNSQFYTITSFASAVPAFNQGTVYVQGNFVDSAGLIYTRTSANLGQSGLALPSGTTSNTNWTYVASAGSACWFATTGGTLPATITAINVVGHYSHTRWSRVDWYGGSGFGPVTPAHDATYLRSTKLVPNYGIFGAPSSAAWSGLGQSLNPASFTPQNVGNNPGGPGYHQHIGVLPQWAALYCTTADARAYAATISNGRTFGYWPFHYRDETTGKPINFLNYPTYGVEVIWENGPPAVTGSKQQPWNIPHMPSAGYAEYLIEGRWSFLETLQFQASDALGQSNPVTRQGGGVICGLNGPYTQVRAIGWAWRTIGQAAGISPRYLGGVTVSAADQTLANFYTQCVHDTALWHNQRFIEGSTYSGVYKNTLGDFGQPSHGQDNPTVTVVTMAGSKTVTMASGNVPYILNSFYCVFVGGPIDGPTATTGIPQGTTVTGVSGTQPSETAAPQVPNAFWTGNTFTISQPALTSGTYTVGAGVPDSQWWGDHWMAIYEIMALHHIYDLAPEGLTNLTTDLLACRNFSYQLAIQVMGTDPNPAFNFRATALYARPFYKNYSTPTGTPQYMTIAEQWAAYQAAQNYVPATAAPGDTIWEDGYQLDISPATSANFSVGYGSHQASALALATESELNGTLPPSGARAAYNLILDAPNYQPAATGQTGEYSANDSPQFVFIPRAA